MTVRHLDKMFAPASVAVIGASDRPGSIGQVVLRNVLGGGFAGPVWPVNPRHATVGGQPAFASVNALPAAPDLAVICTPPAAIPELVASLGKRGARAAVVITAGLERVAAGGDRNVLQAMLEAARPHCLRILGPNCLGLLAPGIGLNASFAHASAKPGPIAFVSQSGAWCTVVLDWARAEGIGFSHFISLGNAADVDFGDVIDYLASDRSTSAILLYIESIRQARKFLSASRAAARNKPIIAVKAGRSQAAARAAWSHTGALAGSDEVFTAALTRAGIVRVESAEELFEAAATLARIGRTQSERLAILTNGGGPGIIAVDALAAEGGDLAELAPQTLAALDRVLPETWSRANPVDIVGDAPSARYADALRILGKDPNTDAILVLHAPTAVLPAIEAARGVIAAAATLANKKLLTCWLGRDAVAASRQAFVAAGIATYDTPLAAVRALAHLAEYRRTQEALSETPPAAATTFTPDPSRAASVIAGALAAGRGALSEIEVQAVLKAYGVPVVESRLAPDAESAADAADALGYPVVVKIQSPDLVHKSDVGGVALDLEDRAAVLRAAGDMRARALRLRPGARVEGFIVQSMIRRPRAFELIIGASVDPIFGPVLLFGQGGTAVEVLADRALALPPLNLALARQTMARTRVARLLAGYRDRPAADRNAVADVLVRISQLVADQAEVSEIDINPLLADDKGVVALDARIRVAPAAQRGGERLAIRPYPQGLEEWLTLADGSRIQARPIRPEDEPAHRAFFERLTPDDIRFRFFGQMRALDHSQLARFTQIDYDREMAFIATRPGPGGEPETLGVVRAIADPNNEYAEFAVIVRSDIKGRGLGHALLDKMVRYCRGRGTAAMVGQVLRENARMRALAEELGFVGRPVGGDVLEYQIDLRRAAA
jgi:acetyltransferase